MLARDVDGGDPLTDGFRGTVLIGIKGGEEVRENGGMGGSGMGGNVMPIIVGVSQHSAAGQLARIHVHVNHSDSHNHQRVRTSNSDTNPTPTQCPCDNA